MSVLRDAIHNPPPAPPLAESLPPPAPGPAPQVFWRPKWKQELEPGRWNLAFWGLLLYLAVDYVRITYNYEILRPFQLGKVSVILTALGILTSRELMSPPRSAIRWLSDVTVLAFVLATFVSAMVAVAPIRAWDAFLSTVLWGLLYWEISRATSQRWSVYAFTAAWLLANFKIGLHVVRYFGANSAYAAESAQIMGGGFGATGNAFFGNSADLGVGMCVVWPVASYLVLARMTNWKRWAVFLFSAIYLGAILFCGSRGAVVGAVAVALVAVIRSPKKVPAILMVLLLVPGIYFLLPGGTKERFQKAMDPEKDKTAGHRLILWAAGRRMFSDHPVLGVGPKCFGVAYLNQYGGASDNKHEMRTWVPHSIYIEAIAQWGLLGTIPLVIIVLQLFRTNAATRRRLRELLGKKDAASSFEFCLATGLDLGFIGYLASGAFVAVLLYPHIWVLLGMSTGLHSYVLRMGQKPAMPLRAPAVSVRGA